MSKKHWYLALPVLALAFVLAGPLSAEEEVLPQALEEAPPEAVTPAPTEVPASPDLQPAPLRMTDCYSLSTCTTSFAACESWCYGQSCGIDYWDSGTQTCYCGTKF